MRVRLEGNRVPTGSPLTALTRTLSVVPPATSTVTPDSVARRAACSFVTMPPVPRDGAGARGQRDDLVDDDGHLGNQRRRGVAPRIRRVEPILIGQQDQQIGVDEIRDQRRQVVVVADLDFLGRHDVVLVDDRNDLPFEQRQQRVARVEVALAIGQVAARQQRLRDDQIFVREELVPDLHQPGLTDRGQHLLEGNVLPVSRHCSAWRPATIAPDETRAT